MLNICYQLAKHEKENSVEDPETNQAFLVSFSKSLPTEQQRNG